MNKEEPSLDEVLSKVDLSEKTELGEVTKEFSENKPSSSNLSSDEQKLIWRATGIYSRYPKTLRMIKDYIDTKRSVKGWNTEMKVSAITGIQQQRTGGMLGGFMNKMFAPRPPQQ